MESHKDFLMTFLNAITFKSSITSLPTVYVILSPPQAPPVYQIAWPLVVLLAFSPYRLSQPSSLLCWAPILNLYTRFSYTMEKNILPSSVPQTIQESRGTGHQLGANKNNKWSGIGGSQMAVRNKERKDLL